MTIITWRTLNSFIWVKRGPLCIWGNNVIVFSPEPNAKFHTIYKNVRQEKISWESPDRRVFSIGNHILYIQRGHFPIVKSFLNKSCSQFHSIYKEARNLNTSCFITIWVKEKKLFLYIKGIIVICLILCMEKWPYELNVTWPSVHLAGKLDYESIMQESHENWKLADSIGLNTKYAFFWSEVGKVFTQNSQAKMTLREFDYIWLDLKMHTKVVWDFGNSLRALVFLQECDLRTSCQGKISRGFGK